MIDKLLAEIVALDPDKRVNYFKDKILPEFKFQDPISRDVILNEAVKLLKPCGVGKLAIRQAVKAILPDVDLNEDEEKEERKNQADTLIEMVSGTTLFHDNQQEPFARLEVQGHYETWPLKSKFFRRWLRYKYFNQYGKSPNSEAVTQAMGVIEGKACFDGGEHKLSLRVSKYDSAFWYDLADPAWRVVKVTPEGWQVVDKPPILFRRYKNTAPQVEPKRSKNGLWKLLDFVNIGDISDKYLLLVYAITCLIPDVPHVIPPFHGQQGAAKSTALRVLRKIVDPAIKELLDLPRDKNEMALILQNNYMPSFDNLDGLQGWQSNMLCCAATGGGISKRKLFTDEDEIILSYLRCVTLNGINLVATRSDLLDRAILFKLDRIDKEKRRVEDDFWQEFEEARPYIVGSLFDALSGAMRIYPTVKLPRLPRMADFCRWGYAAAEAIGIGGDIFLKAYLENISKANDEAITANPVAAAVVALMKDQGYWQGTAAYLLDALNNVAEAERIDTKAKSWPRAANALTKRLTQVKSNLLDAGINYQTRHTNKGSIIAFHNITEKTVTTVTPSQTQEYQGFLGDDKVTISDDSDDTVTRTVTLSSPQKPNNGAACDDSDDSDDKISNSWGSVKNIFDESEIPF